MAKPKVSALLIEEFFAAADERYLPTLRQFHDPKKLAPSADRWKRDHRPWARQQIFKYLELPLDCAGHEPVVKRLFKHAEEKQDDELMAAFAAAFDRLLRRVRRKRHRYDWQTGASWHEEYLHSPRDRVLRAGPSTYHDCRSESSSREGQRRSSLFSYHTRHYLRRRVWRYFRRMGHQRPQAYSVAIAAMLRLYTDADLPDGLAMLDSWSFTHACFGDSDVLEFGASYPRVKPQRSLSELSAAAAFETVWTDAPPGRLLVSLVAVARSRAVRVWAIQLLRKHHLRHAGRIGIEQILPLLDHDDELVQHFAAEALERATGLESVPLETWLKLLETKNALALEILARLMRRHVPGERLTLDQLVALASARPAPVARLGLDYLRERTIATADERAAIARLAGAASPAVAGDIAAWALSSLGEASHYNVDQVSAFFESLLQTAREAAWAWLAPRSAGWNDPALWSRLIETPYDDVRFNVVNALETRAALPGAANEHVAHVWTSVLLGIHRGGRTKLLALKQISKAIADDPARAAPLLPVLAVAIRSVRLPEVRHGLGAVVSAVTAHPPLGDAVRQCLPELELAEEVRV